MIIKKFTLYATDIQFLDVCNSIRENSQLGVSICSTNRELKEVTLYFNTNEDYIALMTALEIRGYL